MTAAKPHKKPTQLTARTADKYLLYEESVQSPEAECAFLDRVYRKSYGRHPTIMREDFCGTALSSCQWVRQRRANRAWGVDLSGKVLNWAKKHNLNKLSEHQRRRITLVQADVLAAQTPRAEVVVAMNFSYFLFLTRSRMRDYFSAARRNLLEEGLFVCDIYGGYDAQNVLEEDRKLDGFTYIWDQARYNPITNETVCHIHFRFPDGSQLHRAFSYAWRLWTIAEIRELLEEAGFSNSTVYWEGTDHETEEGNGVFRPTRIGEVCAGWIAYIVAQP